MSSIYSRSRQRPRASPTRRGGNWSRSTLSSQRRRISGSQKARRPYRGDLALFDGDRKTKTPSLSGSASASSSSSASASAVQVPVRIVEGTLAALWPEQKFNMSVFADDSVQDVRSRLASRLGKRANKVLLYVPNPPFGGNDWNDSWNFLETWQKWQEKPVVAWILD